ncbi:MAG: MFS transporter [Candidatus Omnitrophica bacterium]|nr:MFS transporter [Candidatus Omnitrophota bacterium]
MNTSTNSRSFKALMITQIFGAFNDNAFFMIVSLFALRVMPSAEASTNFVSILSMVFILPFVILSPYAGYLSDRFRKRSVIIATKGFEIVIMLLGFIALASGHLYFMCFVLFLMTTQSAFFGPAKYGILPEILDETTITKGNGYLQMGTFLSIILGMASGGLVAKFFGAHMHYVSFILIAFSLIGFLASLHIEKYAVRLSQQKFDRNPFRNIFKGFKEIRRHKILFITLLSMGFFYFVAQVVRMNVLIFARHNLDLSDLNTSLLVVATALGIGLGSFLAAKLSEGKIEFGLVPLGGLGICVTLLTIGIGRVSFTTAALKLFLTGVSGGLFIVPLSAYYQHHSPQQHRGKYMAVMNIFNALMVLVASLFLMLSSNVLSFNPQHIFSVLGFISIFVTISLCRRWPIAFLRFINWLFTHSLYRVRVVNAKHVPEKGGALLVCNHVSYIDPSLIMASIQRHVRFMMYRPIYRIPWLHPLAKIMKAIPISLKDSPREVLKSMNEAKQAVERGELVCIFAEGVLTRTGNMLQFNRGFEHIMKGVDAPIIPVNIDSIWGSIFTYERGKYFWKWPHRIPYPVVVSFGEVMPSNAKAFQVRQAVQELGAEAFDYRGQYQEKLPLAFIREAKKRPFKLCVADSTGLELNYAKALAMVMLIARKLFNRPNPSENDPEKVGVLLPASVMASLVNGAILMAGKIPVNLNFTASKESLANSIEQCQMRQIITSRKFLDKVKIEKTDMMYLLEDLKSLITSKEKTLSFLKALLAPRWLIVRDCVKGDRNNMHDIATIIFSSGSTGEPKGVMLTHGNIFSNIQGFYQVANVQTNDVVMGVLPFFHSFGFTACLCFPVGTGISAIYHPNPLDAATVGKMVKKYKASIILGTPTFFSGYIRKCTPEQFQSIRYAIAGAEKFQPKMIKAFEDKFSIKPLEGYGATELSPIVTLSMPNPDHLEDAVLQYGNKTGKVGHPIPGIVARIVDVDTKESLDFDQEGLLLIKGPNVMKGYLNNPQKTDEVLKDGWYTTGDVATIDKDGFIHITDRLSRFSKIGGEMVPHIKVEAEILHLLGTSEPVCVVTSVPDERKGERLVVLYVGEYLAEDVWKKLNDSTLPKLWVPKKDDYYRVEEIPLLGTGKRDLRRIKQLALDLVSRV